MALIGGCAKYVPAPIDAASSARAFEARSLDDPDLQRFVASGLAQGRGGEQAPIVRWSFASLTYAALYANPELEVARAKHAVSDAAIVTAGQRPNPTLQLPFSYASNPKPDDRPYTLGLALDLPIETARKRDHRMRQARELSLAAKLDIGHAAWQVRSKLRAALLDLFDARERQRILGGRLGAQEAVVGMLERRRDLGATSTPEVTEARATLARDRLDVEKVRAAADDALVAVAQAIGLPGNALTHTDIAFDDFASMPSDIADASARETALRNRSDLQAALARHEASQAALQLEIANQYPDVHLGPGYTYDAGVNRFSLGLASLALPVFNRNEGPIAEAAARRRQAAAEFESMQARVIGESSRAVGQYRRALATLRAADAVLATQRDLLASQRRALAAGESDRLDATLAEREVWNATLARQEALMQAHAAAGRLEDAMERPLSDDVHVAGAHWGLLTL